MRAQGIGNVLTSAGALLELGHLGHFQADVRCGIKDHHEHVWSRREDQLSTFPLIKEGAISS